MGSDLNHREECGCNAASRLIHGLAAGIFLILSSSFASPADPGVLQTWKLSLRDELPTLPASWDSYSVWGLAFSPDGSRLAIGFGDSTQESEITRRLIVVPMSNPRKVERSFELRLNLSWIAQPCCVRLSWSPDGQHLAVSNGSGRDPQALVFDLKSNSHCEIEASKTFFLSADTLLSLRWESDGDNLSIFTAQCAVKRDWLVQVGIRVLDVSHEPALIAGFRYQPEKLRTHESVSEGLLLRIDNLPETQILANFGPGFIPSNFARGGNSVCAVKEGTMSCRPTSGGQLMQIPIGSGWIMGVKGAANRLAISEFNRRTIPQGLASFLDVSDVWFTLKRRIIWDLDKGQMIAAYTPQVASVRLKGFGKRDRSFDYALSADGQYIAEGSPDSVTVYQIR